MPTLQSAYNAADVIRDEREYFAHREGCASRYTHRRSACTCSWEKLRYQGLTVDPTVEQERGDAFRRALGSMKL